MQSKLLQHIDQHDDYACMMSDAPEYKMAHSITDMALTILRQAEPLTIRHKTYEDNVFHAVLVVLRCLTKYPNIITELTGSEEDICTLLQPLFQRRERVFIPEFYHIDHIRRRRGAKPPALNETGLHLLRLTRALRRKDNFYKQLYKKLRHIHTVWRLASYLKTQTFYDLEGNPHDYCFDFEMKYASGRDADVYFGGTVEGEAVLIKKIAHNNEVNFMREWEALDTLYHMHMLEHTSFPQIYGVIPECKAFIIKKYNAFEEIIVKSERIVKHPFSDALLKSYIQDIYQLTSFLLEQNIRHNDMHLCNLVCDDNKKLKIIDFGMLTKLSDGEDQYYGLVDYNRQYVNEVEKAKSMGNAAYLYFKDYMERIHRMNSIRNSPIFLLKMLLEACEIKDMALIQKSMSILEKEKRLYVIHMALHCHKASEYIDADDILDKDHADMRMIYQALKEKKNGWQNSLLDIAADIASDIKEEWFDMDI